MKKQVKGAAVLAAFLSAGLTLSACTLNKTISTNSSTSSSNGESTASDEDSSAASANDASKGNADTTEQMFTKRDLDASYDEEAATKISFSDSKATVSSKGDYSSNVSIDGSTLKIKAEGVYVITGESSDGQIIVDAADADKVQIVLDGVTITNNNGPCIYVKNADKTFITLAENSKNKLSDTGDTYDKIGDENVDGVIYSKDDITFQGTGSLTVKAGYAHAIVGKDDLKVTGGTYNLTAAKKGIAAEDSVRIKNGDFTIEAGDDAIHADNDKDADKGYVYIAGGTFSIKAGDDGVHAETALTVDDGKIDISESVEGLEGSVVNINGGDINVVSSDDGINAVGAPDASSDKNQTEGAKTDSKKTVTNQTDSAKTDSTETVTNQTGSAKTDSTETVTNQTDSANIDNTPTDTTNGGKSGMTRGAMPGNDGGNMDSTEDAVITITDGTIYVNAGGDGLDSNGYIYIKGGVTTVDGPTDGGNSAMDYGISASVTGGNFAAAGSIGMAETFSSDSKQYSIMYNFDSVQKAGTEVELLDSSGTVICKYTPAKEYQSVIFSSSALKEGTYTIKADDTEEKIEVTDTSTSAGTSGGMGGMGGMNGQMPSDGQMPSNGNDNSSGSSSAKPGRNGGMKPDGSAGDMGPGKRGNQSSDTTTENGNSNSDTNDNTKSSNSTTKSSTNSNNSTANGSTSATTESGGKTF